MPTSVTGKVPSLEVSDRVAGGLVPVTYHSLLSFLPLLTVSRIRAGEGELSKRLSTFSFCSIFVALVTSPITILCTLGHGHWYRS
jgi:hypothetical protein